MSFVDFLHVWAFALGAAVAVGVVALVVLRLLRSASLVLQVVVVAVATVGSLVFGMLIASKQMYVSSNDFALFLWLALLAGAVSVGLAILLGSSLVRNSRRLVVQARTVGAGPEGPAGREGAGGSGGSGFDSGRHVANEFAALGRELAASDLRLSQSREREARAEAARRQLVAWISHDLRTPLAGLRAMAEALDDGVAEDAPRYHRQMLAQVDRLGGMVDDLFQLSTLHAGALRLAVQTMSVTELVDDIVGELGQIARSRGLTLVGRDVADIALEADPDELARAVANLTMNSIRLSPPGSEIVLSARLGEDDFVVLSVTDSAGGIRETDLGRVFEPGWRASVSRTPGAGSPAQVGGAGLGLAIVQGIVVAHHGRVTVSNVDAGCRFELVLPRRSGLV
ncbi:two-component sensor histidine kinase [Frondihabitans sucicola]|uniref:Sensor-like histidine kinase SenX3 n=1 Tax=Frondihabitans sucicola TaxID=1268041 RepID=A0ABM8GME4_9MICO|nr:HAMP domain-containing sensor histidine kinase [Frondihabitans sucicola]BDZ49572.1 two-component sensor histidine kinase [Frondihabitans sucicola]